MTCQWCIQLLQSPIDHDSRYDLFLEPSRSEGPPRWARTSAWDDPLKLPSKGCETKNSWFRRSLTKCRAHGIWKSNRTNLVRSGTEDLKHPTFRVVFEPLPMLEKSWKTSSWSTNINYQSFSQLRHIQELQELPTRQWRGRCFGRWTRGLIPGKTHQGAIDTKATCDLLDPGGAFVSPVPWNRTVELQ